MSSKGRAGSKPKKFENYPTPAWCVDRFMERNVFLNPGLRQGTTSGEKYQVLEPAVGDGAIVTAIRRVRSDILFSGQDIRLTPFMREEGHRRPMLKQPIERGLIQAPGVQFDAAITNPPFSLAERLLIELSNARVPEVALLLRLNFLGTVDRQKLFLDLGYPNVYILPDRPSFFSKGAKKGKQDSAEYAWFHWTGGELRSSTGLWSWRGCGRYFEVLETTPLSVRRPSAGRAGEATEPGGLA